MSFVPIRDAVETIASLAGNYELPGSSLLTDNLVSKGAQQNLSSPLGELAQVGSGIVGGGGLGQNLQSAGGALEQSGLSSLYNSLGNGLSDIGNATGLSGFGSDVGNAASTGWNNFTQGSGLSDFLGGTAQPGSDLTDYYNGFNSIPGSADLSSAAATPAAQPLAGALPSASTVGAAGGGNLGGFGGSLGGDFSNGLSSTSVGQSGGVLGNVGNSDFSAFNTSAPDLSSTPLSNLDIGSQLSNTQNPGNLIDGLPTSQSTAQSLNPSLFNESPTATISGGANGAGTQLGNQFSIPGLTGTPSAGGSNNMGILGSLFGGDSGGASATPSAGSGITNSLLRGGLGYLFNQPNTGGANAINSASQAAQADYQPYLQAGQGAENTLANLYGNNGSAAQTSAQQNFANTPGYQFALNQGINAVNANAAAMGSPLSGNNQQAVNNYAQGTANQTYNNYVNQLQNLASGGLNAAGGSGNAGLTGASAIASLDQNKANAANSAIGTGLQGLFPGGGINLQSLLGNGGSGNQGGSLSLFGY